jgi:hypothetical protein
MSAFGARPKEPAFSEPKQRRGESDGARVTGNAPAGESRRVLGVEETARGVHHFNRDAPSVMTRCVLPCWSDSVRDMWPERQAVFDPSAVMPIPMHDPKYSADWWKAGEAAHQTQLEQQRSKQLPMRKPSKNSIGRGEPP